MKGGAFLNALNLIEAKLVTEKVNAARANAARAGFAQFVDILEGDAMNTLSTGNETIDLLLLDGWKEIYLPLVKMLTPKFRAGTVVIADKIFTFKTTLRPYVEHMQNRANGFDSVTLPLSHGMKYSVRIV